MPIRDTTTWAMACLAALGDSPNLFPFSSVIGIPYFNSLGEEEREYRVTAAPRRRRKRGLGPHLCLMKGMLIQLAAATAAKGTKRLTIGGKCCKEQEWIRRSKHKISAVTLLSLLVHVSHWKYLSKRLQSQRRDHSSSRGTDVGCAKLTVNTPIAASLTLETQNIINVNSHRPQPPHILQSLEKRLEMFYNGSETRESSLLHSYGGIPTPVGVVDNSVKGLVNPLPEDYSRSCPGNMGNRKRKFAEPVKSENRKQEQKGSLWLTDKFKKIKPYFNVSH